MTVRRPILSVTGASGSNLVPMWGADLLGVTITDQEGYESDEAVLRFKAPPFDPPPKGSVYTIRAGWAGSGLAMFGIYTVSRTGFGGDPESGETMEVYCRAADFLDKMKQTGSGHFDIENGFGTAGKIFGALAKEAGVPAVVAPSIDGIEIPYRLRWNQSALDFATDLADEIGAVVKPQAGKLVVRERGKGKSASGKDLPTIKIQRDPLYAWDVDIEERTAHQTAQTAWFDPKTGRLKTEVANALKRGGPRTALHISPSETEARKSAAALAQSLSRWTGTGSFEMPGEPLALAGAPVTVSGFGATIDAMKWESSAVTHDITPDIGWITTVEVETKETTG